MHRATKLVQCCSSMLHDGIQHHRQVFYLQQRPCSSQKVLPGYVMAPMWTTTGGRLTCSKGFVYFSGDGESLMGTSPQHTLQLGHKHDRLQCRHLGGHQLTHTQLVTHHALMGFQGGLQLHHRQTVVLHGTDHTQQSSLWAQDRHAGFCPHKGLGINSFPQGFRALVSLNRHVGFLSNG